jgi:hypothetical protein
MKVPMKLQQYRSLLNCSSIAALAAVAALAGCGGGGGAGDSPVATPSVPVTPADPYAGTAHLKTQETLLNTGSTTGPARNAVQGLIDVCNAYRTTRYKLTAVQPTEALMAGVDVQDVERYYDSGRAVEIRSGYTLTLPDLQRWLDELKTSGATDPATAPDCAAAKRGDITSGWAWLDGVRYELRFGTKEAIGTRGHPSFTATALATDTEVAAWPKKSVLGQTCVVASGAGVPPSLSQGCLWDRFPAKTYLGLPWLLESAKPGTLTELRITTLALDTGKATPAGALDLPAGFSVKVIN